MNYQYHYNRLIERAKNRIIESFTETHHIVPICMGGSNDKENLVELTPEEHYISHQLLVKIHPENQLLAHAAFMMGSTRSNNKLYGWLKRKVANQLRGKPLSKETRQKLSIAQKNRDPSTRYQLPNPKVGSKLSKETRAKQSRAAKGKPKSEETKRKMKLAWELRRAKGVSAETKQKMSEAAKLRKHSDATKLKMSQNSRWTKIVLG